ncbi:MAG: hypothetical protein GF332_04390 [Candidatus Moranbacteria bacterium]|nr:hypothetical protein [Candidatus Moranbacteria bacterium]
MKKKVLVVGSIVYDEIFKVNGRIRNEIIVKNGQIENLNLMLTAQNKKRFPGGTAGNIAYGLALNGEQVVLISCVGYDFDFEYKKHLEKLKIDYRTVKVKNRVTCATYYGISDQNQEQIGIFQPNATSYLQKIKLSDFLNDQDFQQIKVGIFSPGNGRSLTRHLQEFDQLCNSQAVTIFDPGQELSISFNKQNLKKCLKCSDIVIGNEIEIKQFKNLYDLTIKDILNLGVKWVIETQAEKGAWIYNQKQKIKVKPRKPKKLVEATGAGDAFRAGLIKGIISNWNLQKAAEYGAFLGALNVETMGGQNYKIYKEP